LSFYKTAKILYVCNILYPQEGYLHCQYTYLCPNLQHWTKQKVMRYYCIYAMSNYSKLPEAPSAHEHAFSF